MENHKKQKWIIRSVLTLLILFQVVCMWLIVKHSQPSGDEWFTYSLSNNASDSPIFIDHNWINEKTKGTGWIQTEDIRSYLIVDEGESFDYASVLRNQKRDVHPPLYYALIHSLCSLTPGTLPFIWGGVLNIIFWVGINLILWKMGKFFFRSEYERLLPIFFLCISPVTELIVGYDRMYTLLCFFCLLLTYLQMCLRKDYTNKRILAVIAVVTCLGGLTHYYFYMYLVAAFAAYAFEFLVLSREKIKNILPYAVAHFIGGVTAFILYPKAIDHMLFGYRGEQIRDGLFSNKLEGFTQYLKYIDMYCFGKYFVVIVGIALVLLVGGAYVKKVKFDVKKSQLWLFSGTALLFYGIIAFISYEKVWTYITPLYLLVLFGISAVLCASLWFLPNTIKVPACMLVLFIFSGNALVNSVEIAKEGAEDRLEVSSLLETQKGKDCIFIYESWNNLFDNRMLDMLYFDEVFPLPLEELESTSLPVELENRDTEDEVVIYLYNKENEKLTEQLQYIEAEMGTKANFLLDVRKYSVYSMD